MPGPAARLGDSTAHGGVIVVGFPTVLIGNMPAARIGDAHVCPMVTPGLPPIPHVGMPIVSPGAPTVLIGNVPAATIGSIAPCVGPPDSIIMGCPTVLLGTGGGGGAGGGGGGGGGASAANASAATAMYDQAESATKEEHWVEIEFVDKAGLPVSGVPYKFTDTAKKESSGVLRVDGSIRRDGLKKDGECSAELMSLHSAKWAKKKASVGDTIKFSAKAVGFEPNTVAIIDVLRRDLSGPDAVVAQIVTKISSDKVEGEWKFQYGDSIAEGAASSTLKYSSPQFYFVVIAPSCTTRSGMLEMTDDLEVVVEDDEGNAISNEDYVIVFGDGTVRKGKLDGSGHALEKEAPLAHWLLTIPSMPAVRVEE